MKLIISFFIVFLAYAMTLIIPAHASDYGSKAECTVRCKSAKKAPEGLMKGLNDILEEMEKKTGSYQKEYERLKKIMNDHLDRGDTPGDQVDHLMTRDPKTKLPAFAKKLIQDKIKKNTNVQFCFSNCGTQRVRGKQPIDFMYSYLLKVVARLGMENMIKLSQYNIPPFVFVATDEMLDDAARKISQKDFDKMLEKSADDKMRNFLMDVRAKSKNFNFSAQRSLQGNS